MSLPKKPIFKLVPEEKTEVFVYKTPRERELELKLIFCKSFMHASLKEMMDYFDWMKNRRVYKKNSIVWKWKAAFFKQFISSFERKIQEMERSIDKVKYIEPLK